MSELQNAVNNTIDYIDSLEQRDDKLTNILLQICKSINPEATIYNVNEIVGSDEAAVRFLDMLQQHNFMGEPAETWYNRYGDTKAKLTVLRNDLDTLVSKLNNHETIIYKDFGESKRVKLLLEAMTDYNEVSDRTSQALTEINARYKNYIASIARAAYDDDTITADTLDDSESYINDLICDVGEYSTFFKHHRHKSAEEWHKDGCVAEDKLQKLRRDIDLFTDNLEVCARFFPEDYNDSKRMYRLYNSINEGTDRIKEHEATITLYEHFLTRIAQAVEYEPTETQFAWTADTLTELCEAITAYKDETTRLQKGMLKLVNTVHPYLKINGSFFFKDEEIDKLVADITNKISKQSDTSEEVIWLRNWIVRLAKAANYELITRPEDTWTDSDIEKLRYRIEDLVHNKEQLVALHKDITEITQEIKNNNLGLYKAHFNDHISDRAYKCDVAKDLAKSLYSVADHIKYTCNHLETAICNLQVTPLCELPEELRECAKVVHDLTSYIGATHWEDKKDLYAIPKAKGDVYPLELYFNKLQEWSGHNDNKE